MRRSDFTRDFLLLFAGPLVWALHFLAIYSVTGVVCARPGWPQAALLTWGLAGLSLAALAAIGAAMLVPARRDAPDGGRFVHWMTRAAGALAMLAIAYETAAVFLLPLCDTVT